MKKPNPKKSRGQQSSKNILPYNQQERKAVVVIRPDEEVKVDVKTGNCSDLEMYMFLRDLTKHFATVVVNEAEEVVGNDTESQLKYLDWRIEQSGLNG